MSDLYDEPGRVGGALGLVFTAAYGTECSACLDEIAPGDDARADGWGEWIHATPDCEATATAVRPTRNAPRPIACPSCFTVHAGECL